MVLLKNCLGGPKLQYFLRTSQCCDNPHLHEFDELLGLGLTKTSNIALTNDQWTKASLPVWSRARLWIRSVSTLASSAFLASAAGTLPL